MKIQKEFIEISIQTNSNIEPLIILSQKICIFQNNNVMSFQKFVYVLLMIV